MAFTMGLSKKGGLDKKGVFLKLFSMLLGLVLSVVTLLQSKMATIHTLKVDFIQMVFTAQGQSAEKGVFYYKKGKGFRWDYYYPEKKTFWMKDGKVVEYFVEDKIARIYSVEENFWILLENPTRLLERCKKLEEAKVRKGYLLFVETDEGRKIKIFLRQDLLPEEVLVDSESKFLFGRWEVNVKLEDSLFVPSLPSDVDVIN